MSDCCPLDPSGNDVEVGSCRLRTPGLAGTASVRTVTASGLRSRGRDRSGADPGPSPRRYPCPGVDRNRDRKRSGGQCLRSPPYPTRGTGDRAGRPRAGKRLGPVGLGNRRVWGRDLELCHLTHDGRSNPHHASRRRHTHIPDPQDRPSPPNRPAWFRGGDTRADSARSAKSCSVCSFSHSSTLC